VERDSWDALPALPAGRAGPRLFALLDAAGDGDQHETRSLTPGLVAGGDDQALGDVPRQAPWRVRSLGVDLEMRWNAARGRGPEPAAATLSHRQLRHHHVAPGVGPAEQTGVGAQPVQRPGLDADLVAVEDEPSFGKPEEGPAAHECGEL